LSDYDDNVGPGTGYTVAWFSNAARTISVTTTGNLAVGSHTFYATVTNNITGCDANAQLVITINPNPTCSISGEQTICTGGSSTFTAIAGMASYSWTGPVGFTPATTPSITVSIAGTYEVTVTDANGCSSTCSRELIVESCGYGCTPGFWQGGAGEPLWDDTGDDIYPYIGFTTTTLLSAVLTDVAGNCGIPSTITMIEAITLGGGNCKKLMRHGVAAILNASTLVEYPLPAGINDVAGLKLAIETAVSNCNCEELASQLAANNELNHDLCGTITRTDTDRLISNAALLNSTAKTTETNSFKAHPVPFKDQLTVSYNYDYVTDVKIEVFNILGIVVASKHDGQGHLNKSVSLNIPSTGQEEVYVVKVTTNRGSSTQKVISSR
jgi:hypothetical protein